METQRPRQLRLHQGQQTEPLRTKGTGTEIPTAHFRMEGAGTVVAPIGSRANTLRADFAQTLQVSPLSFSKSASHFLQTLRTALPLFLMDALGSVLSLALAQTAAALLLGAETPFSSALIPSLVFVLTYCLLGLYPGLQLNPIIELKNLVVANVSAGCLLIVLAWSQGLSHGEILTAVFFTLFATLLAPLMRITARAACSRTSWWGQPALIIGSGESARRLMQVLSAKSTGGLRPIGMIDDEAPFDPDADPRPGFIGTLADVRILAEKHNIFWAIIASSPSFPFEKTRAFQESLAIPNVVVVPDVAGFPSLWSRAHDVGGVMGIHHRERLLNAWTFLLKRLFDIVGVVLGTLILSPFLVPLFLLTWASIRIYSPGPVFFGQDRVGKNGRPFKAWKFRTMVIDADSALSEYLDKHPELQPEWESRQKLKNDPRIIRGISGFLRLTSLDELPQLWNVLAGNMSLVGPRPFTLDQLELYGEAYAHYRQIRPGMTGLWQISGRNHMTFRQRAELDVYYIRNWSWWLDLFILGRTIKTVVLREGAF